MTGTPVAARKRLQFSLPIEPIAKVSFMKTLPEALLPIMWVEEVNTKSIYNVHIVRTKKL